MCKKTPTSPIRWDSENITTRFTASKNACGSLILTGAYTYDGHGARMLTVKGDFSNATLTLNGCAHTLNAAEGELITNELVIGKNDIILTFEDVRSYPDIIMLCEDHLIRVTHEKNLIYKDKLPPFMEKHISSHMKKLEAYPKIAQLYKNGYEHTARTVMDLCPDGTFFVVSGDIPGMWLRDSSTQLTHYASLSRDPEIAFMLEGVLRRQMRYIRIDPYANAFNRDANGNGHIDDEPLQSTWVFERKYEIDSLCYPMRLLYLYWKASGNEDLIKEELEQTARVIVDLWRTEQYHSNRSPYIFIRRNPPVPWDTIEGEGKGNPVAYTGMTWSGFRPSDDGCKYGYLTASEMFAVVVLGYMAEMLFEVCKNDALAEECRKLACEIDSGIKKYCIVEHEKYGRIYACEVDGYGNYSLFDDANIPSLLSAPYIGYCDINDELYQNTRKFLLSSDNPYYFEGKCASGIGSRHTPDGYIWHLAMIMQGLTETDASEKKRLLFAIAETDADTGYLHEGFDANFPNNYTREWFTWPNSLYAEFIEQCIDEGII